MTRKPAEFVKESLPAEDVFAAPEEGLELSVVAPAPSPLPVSIAPKGVGLSVGTLVGDSVGESGG